MIGVDDIVLNFCVSCVANNIPTIKNWFTRKPDMRSKLNNCYKNALSKWCSNRQIRESVPDLYVTIEDLIKFLSGRPDLNDTGASELIKLWAEEIRSDDSCCSFIVENKVDFISIKIDSYFSNIFSTLNERFSSIEAKLDKANSVLDRISVEEERPHKNEIIDPEKFIAEQKSKFNIVNQHFNGLQDSHIYREELDVLSKWALGALTGEDNALCFLIGNAGVGKSVVIRDLIESLETQSIITIGIKADAIQQNNISGYYDTLIRVADQITNSESRVIFIIDQIDALSPSLSNDKTQLNEMTGVIASLIKKPNAKVIVSCRSYNTDYDAVLFDLKSKSYVCKIGDLKDEDVSYILNRLDPMICSKLDAVTFSLLKTAHNLNAFCYIYQRNHSRIKFGDPVELYDALWEEYISKVPDYIALETLEQTLYDLAGMIRNAGTLRPNLIPTTVQKKYFDYLASNGLITIEGNSVSFFHQSFYEYTLARRYNSSGRSLLNDFKDGFQGLELRSIVKAVLEYERSHNETLFVDEVRSIITSESVRLHIKLLAVSVFATIHDPQPAEKRLIKEVCKKDDKLLMYFLRGVQSDGWFATVYNLVKDVIPDLRKDNPALSPIIGCLSNFVFNHPEDVYGLVNMISDTETKLFSTAYMLGFHNDYRTQCVLDAYHATRPQNTPYSVELLEDAFQTNERFTLNETESLLVNYLTSEEKESRHDEYELVEVLAYDLFNNHPKNFLLTLNSAIIKTIEKSSYEGCHGFTCTKAFNGLFLDAYTGKLLKMYEDLLVKFSSESTLMRPVIEKLLALRNETSVSMAFSAMAASPELYDDLIRPLIASDKAINRHLFCDVKYFYLKLLKSWYLTLNDVDAARYQRHILSYKSAIDLYYDKERHLCPHLWSSKWDLICNTLPEDGLIPEMEKLSKELLRRFTQRSLIDRPDHNETAAYYCGGVVSDEIYSKFSLRNWLTSFLKLDENRGWRDGEPPISLNEHASAFKKCVATNPDKFRDFVRELSSRKDIKPLYKVAGVEGLLAGGTDPLTIWDLAAPYISVEYAKVDSYSFSQIAELW